MKRILLATALLLSLGACVSNTATNGITERTDKFTGATIQDIPDKCLTDFAGDKFCVGATANTTADELKVTLSYQGTSWMFMHRAEGRIMNTGQTFTLFDVDHFDVYRRVWCCGEVKESITETFKLSTFDTNPHPIAQMMRAEAAIENPRVVVRLTGDKLYSDFD